MKYYEITLKKGEEEINYKLRLTSGNSIALEEKMGGKSIMDIVQDVSVTNVCKLLEYMARDNDHNFGRKEATELYDLLVDNEYTLFDIVYKVIYKVLVQSGFMTEKELEAMMEGIDKQRKKIQEEVQEKL